MNMIDRIEDIQCSFAQTVEWCARRTVYEGSNTYRSGALQPLQEIGTCTDDLDIIAATVMDVVRRRSELLAADRRANRAHGDAIHRGRLLAFFPNRTICDGVGRDETSGFLDGCNVPPWDT